MPDYLDTLALAYQETGQTQRAIETQRSAIALTPEDSSERTEYQERLAELEVASTASR